MESKVKKPYITQGLTLGVKGLRMFVSVFAVGRRWNRRNGWRTKAEALDGGKFSNQQILFVAIQFNAFNNRLLYSLRHIFSMSSTDFLSPCRLFNSRRSQYPFDGHILWTRG